MNLDLLVLILGVLGILWVLLGFTFFSIACLSQAMRNERERNESPVRKNP